MNKSDRFYFENFVSAADCSVQAARYLVRCLNDYDISRIDDMLHEMHDIEHTGDVKKHELTAALARAFVTPVDREDLALISQNIDEVSDAMEEIIQRFYVDRIEHILPEAHEFASRLVGCCETMKSLLAEFINFKKPQHLHEMIVEMNRIEEECDRLYLDATRKVREHCDDTLEIIFWREIYDRMEECADACEHVADCVETVVMKNT